MLRDVEGVRAPFAERKLMDCSLLLWHETPKGSNNLDPKP